jgi:hypothetical protein
VVSFGSIFMYERLGNGTKCGGRVEIWSLHMLRGERLEWNRNLLEFSNVCHRVRRVSKMRSNGNFDIRKEIFFLAKRGMVLETSLISSKLSKLVLQLF